MPVPGTVLFIEHHLYAQPAMLGEAFTEAGYDVGVLALPDTRSETADFQALSPMTRSYHWVPSYRSTTQTW
jgi:hypothetical protein